MNRLMLIVAALLFGCNNAPGAIQPTMRPTPTTASTTQAVLEPIELRYGIYLARLDLRVTISAEGALRSVRTDNKSYGTGDIDPKNERVEVREGKLTAEQIADLSNLFAGWDSLSTTSYGGVPDGGDVSIRYGDKTVSGGSAVPKQVEDARIHLMELARSMPVVKQ
jgi:hypothetical protein